MKLIDGKKQLLAHIEEASSAKKKELENLTQEEIATIEAAAQKKLIEEKTKILLSQEKEIEKIKKQQLSAFDLNAKHQILKAKSKTISQVMDQVKKESPTCEFYEVLAKKLSKTAKIKEFLVPKGIKITAKHTATLNESAIIGIVSDKEEVMLSVDDLIQRKESQIIELIEEELF